MYNEEAIARTNTEIILSYTNKLPPIVTVLVVNDGSQDATGHILEELLKHYNNEQLHLISHSNNLGYGAALQTGIKYASENNYDYTIFMDSDLTNHPKYLKNFYEKMEEGWDYIKATRYSKGGAVDGVPWGHRIMSTVGNYIAGLLYGLPLTDYTNGFRAVKTNILKQINYTENGFVIIMEELYHAKSLTKSFCEIPYVLTSRTENQGQSHFSYGPGVCMRYLKYAIKSFLQKR
jgi:glycosyltransferase involved in cell wall biosynthesis